MGKNAEVFCCFYFLYHPVSYYLNHCQEYDWPGQIPITEWFAGSEQEVADFDN